MHLMFNKDLFETSGGWLKNSGGLKPTPPHTWGMANKNSTEYNLKTQKYILALLWHRFKFIQGPPAKRVVQAMHGFQAAPLPWGRKVTLTCLLPIYHTPIQSQAGYTWIKIWPVQQEPA